jgi:catechol 2,3-dioxygenase-like lactoylglutathione lyase family enzyme
VFDTAGVAEALEGMMSLRLASLCLITGDVGRLGSFYRDVLQFSGQGDDQFLSFQTSTIQLSICSVAVAEGMAPGSMLGSGTGRCVLEFEVGDVDAEHARLTTLGAVIVKPPTTQPWGLRSVWLRDPDGNLVNFFARVG